MAVQAAARCPARHQLGAGDAALGVATADLPPHHAPVGQAAGADDEVPGLPAALAVVDPPPRPGPNVDQIKSAVLDLVVPLVAADDREAVAAQVHVDRRAAPRADVPPRRAGTVEGRTTMCGRFPWVKRTKLQLLARHAGDDTLAGAADRRSPPARPATRSEQPRHSCSGASAVEVGGSLAQRE
jgi:hypothetical protein